MKTNKSIVTATLKEVEEGKAFTNIEGLPAFKESDYTVTETDHRFELIEQLRNVVFPSLPADCSIENHYSGILATDLFSLNTLLGSMIENKIPQLAPSSLGRRPMECLSFYPFQRIFSRCQVGEDQ